MSKTRVFALFSVFSKIKGIVHAEVPERFDTWSEFIESLNQDSRTREDAVWNRLAIESVYHVEQGEYWQAEFVDESRFIEGISLVVHGHTGEHESVVCGNQVWIDTGFTTSELTILAVDELFELINSRIK